MKEKALQGRWMMEKGGLKSVGEKGGGGVEMEERGLYKVVEFLVHLGSKNV